MPSYNHYNAARGTGGQTHEDTALWDSLLERDFPAGLEEANCPVVNFGGDTGISALLLRKMGSTNHLRGLESSSVPKGNLMRLLPQPTPGGHPGGTPGGQLEASLRGDILHAFVQGGGHLLWTTSRGPPFGGHRASGHPEGAPWWREVSSRGNVLEGKGHSGGCSGGQRPSGNILRGEGILGYILLRRTWGRGFFQGMVLDF